VLILTISLGLVAQRSTRAWGQHSRVHLLMAKGTLNCQVSMAPKTNRK